jgi:hypothetical protein
MIQFECSFECATREEATYALSEIISQINEGFYCGYLNGAYGSWSSIGEDEKENDEL